MDRAIVSSPDCRVLVLTLPDLEPVTVFKTARYAKALAFSPVDRRLLVGCDDGTLFLLGEGPTKPTKLPKWLSACTCQVAWSADRLAWSGGGRREGRAVRRDVSLRVLDLEGQELLRVPVEDRRTWFLKSSRGRFLTCEL